MSHSQQRRRFVYCTACKLRVVNPSEPCASCHSAENLIDWVEPAQDCQRLINDYDCLERGDANPCNPCLAWDAWETARTGGVNV